MGVYKKALEEMVLSICTCDVKCSLDYLDHASICPAHNLLQKLYMDTVESSL